MKRNSMEFKVMYSDDSGIQYAVKYNEYCVDREIGFESIDSIDFPIERLDWLIEALQDIKDNLK